ncbi:hypothetical protein C3L33_13498, partial [Rhododendron williamsianum]
MSRVYVGNLDPRVSERELEDEFRTYGVLRSVWVARRPPGYAFIEFDDKRDALDAIRDLDGVIAQLGEGPHADLATAGHLLIAALTVINFHFWLFLPPKGVLWTVCVGLLSSAAQRTET